MTRDTSRDPRAFVAPLLSTLLTLPLGAAALFFVGLSPMACDSCDGAASDRFDASYRVASTFFAIGLLVVGALLAACWALPRRRRDAGRRLGLALAAPAAVLLDCLVFHTLVDWP
ncbi:hypothetical protein ACWFQ8_04070 [Streptomyces sp. NPDC055254]